jgi:hypothetical protein
MVPRPRGSLVTGGWLPPRDFACYLYVLILWTYNPYESSSHLRHYLGGPTHIGLRVDFSDRC